MVRWHEPHGHPVAPATIVQPKARSDHRGQPALSGVSMLSATRSPPDSARNTAKPGSQSFARKHGFQVVDLSQPGASTSQAAQRVRAAGLAEGLVLIEIGGNDLPGGASAFQFAQALETLVRRTQGPSRKLLMLELPLFPFNHGTAWPNAVSPASMMSS